MDDTKQDEDVADVAASAYFSAYRTAYPTQSYPADKIQNADELTDDSAHAEVSELAVAPASRFFVGVPATAESRNGTNKYLWLITPSSVPHALEEGPLGLAKSRGRLAHTNLSGGRDSHCGGELWYKDSTTIWITGGSGRYPPRSAAELEAVAESVRAAGYRVASCGWDDERGGPARLFRGDEVWS